MNDATTLVFNLTYVGTLGVAFLMLLGQLVAFSSLLALAATCRLLTCAGRVLMRRLANSADANP